MATRKIVKIGNGRRFEGAAESPISPGHLVGITSTGTLQPHNAAGGVAAPIFAVEREWFGEGVEDAYAAGDLVSSEFLYPGQECMALFAAAAHSISPGDVLQSAGDGTLEARDPGTPGTSFPGHPVAQALEAVGDLSGGSATHFRVLIL